MNQHACSFTYTNRIDRYYPSEKSLPFHQMLTDDKSLRSTHGTVTPINGPGGPRIFAVKATVTAAKIGQDVDTT